MRGRGRLAPNFAANAFDMAVGARTGLLGEFLRVDRAEPLDAYLIAKGLPAGHSSLLALSRADILNMPEARRGVLRERLDRRVIPALSGLRNDNSLWFRCGDVEVGVLPESAFP